MNPDTIRQVERLVKGAVEAAEQNDPSVAFALLSSAQDRLFNLLPSLKAQVVARWGNAEAAE